jgi:ATP-dependent RNA helicase A
LNIKYFSAFLKNRYSIGPKFRQRFLCEVRVEGFPYVGAGNSTNKKDAEKNASRDFVSFLVRSGKINESEVPNEGNESLPPNTNPGPSCNQQQSGGNYSQESYGGSSSGNLSNFSPNQLGQAYRPAQYENDFGPQSYMDRAQQQARMEEAESLDVNAGIHGNWTIENAKSKLNQFMQAQKIQGEFRYNAVGPDHNR